MKVVVAGGGAFGVKHLDGIKNIDGVEVEAVVGRRPEPTQKLAAEHGIPMLLYAGGEALRFDDRAITVGMRGIISVMRAIGMLQRRRPPESSRSPGPRFERSPREPGLRSRSVRARRS